MKYLCLIYTEEKRLDAMSTGEWEALVRETLSYHDDLRGKGHFLFAQALQRAETATTVRTRHGSLTTTEGSVNETREQLGGFILIDARDLSEAIQVASKIPAARVGSIEVRPVRESDREDRWALRR